MNLITNLVLRYLRFFAKLSLKIHKPTVIGITGSVGKSSTRNIIYGLLKDYFPTKMISKGNSETGIPLGILGLSPINYSKFDWIRMLTLSPFGLSYLSKTKYLIIEMGVDDPYPPKNMEFLLTIVKPAISIFLNVHPVHTMQFEKSISNILQTKKMNSNEKLKLILIKISEEKGKIIINNDNCVNAIYNSDNYYVENVISNFKKTILNNKIKFFSFGNKNTSDLCLKKFEVSLKGSKFLFGKKDKKDIVLVFDRYLLPEAYKEGLMTGILVGKMLGLSIKQIKNSLVSNFLLPKGRVSLFIGINNSYILDSSYNSSKASVLSFLELLNIIKNKYKDKKIIFLMGDMRELGKSAKLEHEEVFNKLKEVVDYLYCVGPLTKEFIIDNKKFKIDLKKLNQFKWFNNSTQAGKFLANNLPTNSVILIKGSQNTIFLEEAIKFLLNDKKDQINLCRQEKFWKNEKKLLQS
ncbi:MAG: Mur ligase family protein [bacterium]